MFAEAAREELRVSSSEGRQWLLTHLLLGFQPFVDIVVNESSPEELQAAGLDNCEGFMLVAVTPVFAVGCLL